MPRIPATEWLLARITTPTRAAAILGDLTEMSATRGRLWFWTTYVRTLISLGWRTPVAIVAAVAFAKYLRGDIATWIMPHGNFPLQRGQIGELHLFFIASCWAISFGILFCTFIVFPYVAIRFGLRNRLTYLTGVLFLLAIPAYSFIPWVDELTGSLIALTIVAAFGSPLWRWQMIFLAANYPITRLVFYVCINDPLGIFHPHHHLYPMSLFGMRIDDPVAIAVTIILGPYLHRWLLQPRSTKVAYA